MCLSLLILVLATIGIKRICSFVILIKVVAIS